MSEPITVLVVEDNKIMSKMICDILNSDKRIKVVAIASNGFDAYEKICLHKPDIMTLDINMPIMGGLELLELLRNKNIFVHTLIISSLALHNSSIAVKALSLGALDIVVKPPTGNILEISADIMEKITYLIGEVLASTYSINDYKDINKHQLVDTYRSEINDYKIKQALKEVRHKHFTMPKVVAIGISTGGPAALRIFLSMIPKDFKIPILIVQHIPHEFSKSLVSSLQSISNIEVKEALLDEKLVPSTVYISPGDKNMGIYKNRNGNIFIDLIKHNGDYNYTPSIDYLFESIAHTLHNSAIAIIMTGMGSDGINGLEKLYNNNTLTIAQDEATSIVFGMPKIAIQNNLAVLTLSLYDVAEFLKRYISWRVL